MPNHAPEGVRGYGRLRLMALVSLGVVVSVCVAFASPASAAETPTAFNSASTATGRGSAYQGNTVQGNSVTASNPFRRATGLWGTNTGVWSDRASVGTGAAVRLSGQVTYGYRNGRIAATLVNLQVKSGDSWTTMSSQSTSPDGYVAFTVKPTASSTYRLWFPGYRDLASSVSGDLTIAVVPKVVARASGTKSATAAVTKTKASAKLPAAPAVQATGNAAKVLAVAAAQTGKPYQFAAAGPNAFDCSGLTEFVFAAVGIALPHNADAQKNYGRAVSRADALPGDLIIFTSGGYGYHVAIYAGGDYMYDAPNASTPVGKHQIYPGTVIFRRLV